MTGLGSSEPLDFTKALMRNRTSFDTALMRNRNGFVKALMRIRAWFDTGFDEKQGLV